MIEANSAGRSRFSHVVDTLCAANDDWWEVHDPARRRHSPPSRDAIAGVVDDLRAVLFPGHFGVANMTTAGFRYYVGARLDKAHFTLTEQVRSGLALACEHRDEPDERACFRCGRRAVEVADALVASLPRLRSVLDEDIEAAYAGDPTARFMDETLVCYPGVAAVTQHRIAHELYALAVPLIPRIVSDIAHTSTGIDIHPGAEIGAGFFIDHGTGVVIGEHSAIGKRVRIHQGVTLGVRGFANDRSRQLPEGIPRSPVIEDDVVIHAGATVTAGVTVGRGSTIGGNVWLTRDVEPGAHVSQAQVRHHGFGSGILAESPRAFTRGVH